MFLLIKESGGLIDFKIDYRNQFSFKKIDLSKTDYLIMIIGRICFMLLLIKERVLNDFLIVFIYHYKRNKFFLKIDLLKSNFKKKTIFNNYRFLKKSISKIIFYRF